MIDKAEKRIFYSVLGICLVGYLIAVTFGEKPETNKVSKYEQCLADNNIEIDQSVLEKYYANIPETTEEMASEYIKEYLEKGEAVYGGKQAEENGKLLRDEITRYTKLAYELCGDMNQ